MLSGSLSRRSRICCVMESYCCADGGAASVAGDGGAASVAGKLDGKAAGPLFLGEGGRFDGELLHGAS